MTLQLTNAHCSLQLFAGKVASRLARPTNRLNKLIRKTKSVVRLELDSLEAVAERRMVNKISATLENPSHPLYDELWQMGSSFSHRLIPPKSKKEPFRRSFVPTAIRQYSVCVQTYIKYPSHQPHTPCDPQSLDRNAVYYTNTTTCGSGFGHTGVHLTLPFH